MTNPQSAVLSPQSWQFDGVVRLTRIGVIYVFFTIVIGFAAINTGNNSLYIGLTFMLGCLILSGLASKGGLKHLHVEVVTVDQPWARRAVPATLRIRNASPIWNVRDVIIMSDDLARPVLLPIAPKRSTVELDVSFLFRRRGIVQLKTLDFYTRYPFGFFLKKRRMRIASEVVVFPRLVDETLAEDRFRLVSGEMTAANRPGPGTEIHSFREFVPGDSMRHVYWKKSARLGRWIIKQTDSDATRIIHVAVDPYKPRHVSDEQFEDFVSEVTTFVHEAIGRGLDVVLTLPRHTIRAHESHAAPPMYRELALLEPSFEPFAPVLDRETVFFTVRSHEAAATA